MPVQQLGDLPCHPRLGVNAVRDMADRHARCLAVRPEWCPDLRDTSPCRRDTPFTCFDIRSDATVMWNRPGSSVGCVPISKNVSRLTPSSSQMPPEQRARSSNVNVSCPAGTGVCVVNTLRARTWRVASSNGTLRAVNSRTRSTIMNAA
jgi:hypothetical protein